MKWLCKTKPKIDTNKTKMFDYIIKQFEKIENVSVDGLGTKEVLFLIDEYLYIGRCNPKYIILRLANHDNYNRIETTHNDYQIIIQLHHKSNEHDCNFNIQVVTLENVKEFYENKVKTYGVDLWHICYALFKERNIADTPIAILDKVFYNNYIFDDKYNFIKSVYIYDDDFIEFAPYLAEYKKGNFKNIPIEDIQQQIDNMHATKYNKDFDAVIAAIEKIENTKEHLVKHHDVKLYDFHTKEDLLEFISIAKEYFECDLKNEKQIIYNTSNYIIKGYLN